MYIGYLAWLVAFAIFIANPINLLLLPLYIFLVNCLYIVPEEKALENLFENEFREYKNRVKRWI
jgi:protein-S-isoprenylcysteine O-methyltransferase Ste14